LTRNWCLWLDLKFKNMYCTLFVSHKYKNLKRHTTDQRSKHQITNRRVQNFRMWNNNLKFPRNYAKNFACDTTTFCTIWNFQEITQKFRITTPGLLGTGRKITFSTRNSVLSLIFAILGKKLPSELPESEFLNRIFVLR
jgi:hypothetical protein